MGEKYGSIRVPGEVESAEFEMILDAAVEAGLDTQILEEWYCRDENAVPPAYYLKPKAQMLKNFQNSVSPPAPRSYGAILMLLKPLARLVSATALTGVLFSVPSQMESSSAAKTKNDKAWRTVSEEIKRIFRTAVLHLQEKGTMKSAEAKKFLCSGRFQPPFNVKAQEFHFK